MLSRSLMFAISFACLLSACKSDDPSAPLFTGTTVEILGAPSDGVLLTEGELQLTARVRNAEGVEVEGSTVRWSSTDASRATVTSGGRVVGVRPGDVSVRVNAGGATDERPLSVRTRVPLPGSTGPSLASTLLDGAVQITLNAGAVPSGTALHLRSISDPAPLARLVNGTAIELGPSGVSFNATVTLGLKYPSSVAGAEQPFLRIHRLEGGEWRRLSGGSVDLTAGRVFAAITRTGIYAVLRSAGVATLRVDAGDGQRAMVGSYVATAPRVMVRDAADRPVEGAVIRFSVTSGGGAIVGEATAVSNAEGRATLVGQWRLGPTATTNVLSAELVGGGVPAVTFTATAETVSLVITRELAGAVSGRAASTQPRLEFRTSSGAVVPVSDGVSVELLSGSGTLVGTLRAEAQSGVVTFTNLRIDGSGAHQLRFTSGGSLLSGSVFTVTQELAALQVLVQPAGAVDDKAFETQPVILLLDDAGLPYLPEKEVTASISSGPGELRGTRTVTSSAGRATFTNLRINDDGTHRLRFETSSPSRFVLSNSFTVVED